ncbi:MAG TPA: flagellar basal body P-ring formation chaperone FlgA [Bauldia sp.]|nr:flagellar basal body P-ring formation chaperone FlgA [Bauldia sp.]
MRISRPILALLGLLLAAPAVRAGDDTEALPIAAVTIYPGQTIADAMLVDRDFPAGTADRYPIFGSREGLVGKVAKRTLPAGKLIALNAVSTPALVERGTIVQAVFRTPELTIATAALALEAGALDQAIQVRNIDTGKVIVGVVQADGTVRVGGGS